MATKHKDHIAESLQTLRALEKKHKGTREGERISFLRMLKEDPTCTLTNAATQLGRSRPTVQRWWDTYRQRGLQAAIHVPRRSGGRPARLSGEHLAALRQKVQDEGIRNVSALQTWMKQELGIEYSRQGVQYLLKAKVGEAGEEASGSKAVRDQSDAPAGSSWKKNQTNGISHFSKEAIEFLNGLPLNHDVRQWIIEFRERLRMLLSDVDRVSVAVNVACDLREPGSSRVETTISQMFNGRDRSNSIMVSAPGIKPSQRLHKNLKTAGFPFHLYQSPVMFEYHIKQMDYVGAIVLWRDRHKSPISEETLGLMKVLEPFILFILSDIVARHRYSDRTVDNVFSESIGMMLQQIGFTEREQQVVVLQLFGHSYDQIADRLSLSINTVRKHVASIYRKTGTHSFAELLARYFTPLLGS